MNDVVYDLGPGGSLSDLDSTRTAVGAIHGVAVGYLQIANRHIRALEDEDMILSVTPGRCLRIDDYMFTGIGLNRDLMARSPGKCRPEEDGPSWSRNVSAASQADRGPWLNDGRRRWIAVKFWNTARDGS